MNSAQAVSDSANGYLVLVTETWPPEINGVAMTLLRIAQGLEQRGWRVSLVRPRQKAPTDTAFTQYLVPGLPIPGYAGLRFGLPVLGTLLREWRKRRPDIVHIATQGPLGWAALKAAHRLAIPVTTSFHTNFHQYCRYYRLGIVRGMVQRYLRQFHNQAKYTITPNESLSRALREEGYRHVMTIGRGVDRALFDPQRRDPALRAAWGAGPEDLVVIYVGRIAAEKNLQGVLQAFAHIRLQQPGAAMVWVGDGPLLPWLRQRHPAHVFAGVQTGAALARHYASADIFLFPSLTETFGNVVLEAMSSGLAVVAYRYAAAAAYIRDGVNGLLADYGDSHAFNRQAAALAALRHRVAPLGEAAATSLQNLPWENICDQFDAVLRQALGADGQPSEINQH